MPDTYSQLREFADSWALVALFAVFVLAVLWAYRPGSREVYRDTAASIFRNQDRPAKPAGASFCAGCDGCSCTGGELRE